MTREIDMSNDNPLKDMGVISIQSLETRGDKGIYEDRGFYNEFELMEAAKKLVKELGNDADLGAAVRKLYGETT